MALTFDMAATAAVAAGTMLLALFAGDSVTGPARVIDGDTIEIADVRIRLEGIDAPELHQTCEADFREWSCGLAARAALGRLVAGHDVGCAVTGTDRYGRALAVCYAGPIEINRALVASGWAWAYRRYSERYVADEAEARRARLGVWRGPSVAPWDWRRNNR